MPNVPTPNIPDTPLNHLYRLLRATRQADRLLLGDALLGNPSILDRWFATSVRAFAQAKVDVTASFGGKPFAASAPAFPPFVPGTGLLTVRGAHEHLLRVVAREIVPARGTVAGANKPQAPPTSALQADLLLIGEGGVPAIAEVKIAGASARDTDPLLALIQALAVAAPLAPAEQRARLASRYPGAGFPMSGPYDVLVVLSLVTVPPPNSIWYLLYDVAKSLASKARAGSTISKHIRHLKLIEARPTGKGWALEETGGA